MHIESPTSLKQNGQGGVKRLGNKPLLIVMAIFTGAMLYTIFNLFSNHSDKNKIRAEVPKQMEAATQVGEEVIKNDTEKKVPAVNLSENNTPSEPKIPIGTEDVKITEIDEAKKELIQKRMAKLQEAMNAPIKVDAFEKNQQFATQNQPQMTTTATAPQTQSANAEMLENIRRPIVPALAGDEDQNKQAEKEAFLLKASQNPQTQYLESTRKAALSPYELKRGTVIPSVLISGINSDLPGNIIGQVSEDVYDTRTGRHLLIPQGTKIFGKYDSNIAYAQDGVMVAWQSLIFPDSSTLELQSMFGADQGGFSGFRDQVNNHYLRLLGFGLATSAFASLFQISQNDNVSTNGVLTPSQIAAQTTAQNLTQLGIDITRKNLNIQPTITIRPGYRFLIMVNKDVIFPGTYARQ